MSALPSGRESEPLPERSLRVTVNGADLEVLCADRTLLVELVREVLDLKGTHIGCLTGDCGACTLMVDDRIVKSCLMLAAGAEGAAITTVEGLAPAGELHPIQQAFWDHDGFQCGFCLPGHLFAAVDLLRANRTPSDEEIRAAIGGNLCRCTGYEKIIDSIRAAAGVMAENGEQALTQPARPPGGEAT
jgi:carbon-monoxide dehydrogenase small subunit